MSLVVSEGPLGRTHFPVVALVEEELHVLPLVQQTAYDDDTSDAEGEIGKNVPSSEIQSVFTTWS